MAHGLMARDAMFSGKGVVPWHGLGEVYDDLATFDEALDRAKLRWTVSLRPLKTADADAIMVPDRYAITRDDTKEIFEVVSDMYRPFQNVELARFGSQLFDTDEKVVETAGSLFNGKRVWLLVSLPDDILVGGKDRVQKYVVLASGHDGGHAVHIVNTAVRVVCNNTLTCALANYVLGYSFRHGETMNGRIADARKSLKMTFGYYAEFEKTMNEFAQTTFNESKFEQLTERLLPYPKDKLKDFTEKQRENLEAYRAQLLQTHRVSPTVDRDNAYGAFNAVTQWTDHVRDADRKQTDTVRARRLEGLWFGDELTLKTKAVEGIRELAGISK